MKLVIGRIAALAAAASIAALATGAAAQTDARAGLKAGVRDAGQAASHISLVSTTPPAPGMRVPYFDGTPPAPGTPPTAALAFANSDMAFEGTKLFQGNFQGFNVYDIANPVQPKLLASIVCPAGQGDVAVHGNLLFYSVEPPAGRLDCGKGGTGDAKVASKERFRGVRIFDISNLADPKQVAAIQTCQGSHTVTLVPDKRDPKTLYAYSSGLAGVRSADEMAGCSADEADPNTSLFSIDVIKVPLDAPEKAAIVARPRLFADAGKLNGLAQAGKLSSGKDTMATRNCHDITVYPAIDRAGAACMGNGLLLDISNPANPKRLDAASDPNFGTWHSATFNNKGDVVLFTDEWGGGTQPRCRPTDPQYWGGDATFKIEGGGKLAVQGYYKIPNTQSDVENCVAHNGNLIPVPGRDVMVQAWYQGGLSVFDFTDTKKPVEIAFFDRGPLHAGDMWVGGYWSTYWYNGRIYGSEITRGLDVLKLEPSAMLSKNEIAAAELIKEAGSNPQTQTRIVWPDKPVVARAYLDQLLRTKAIGAAQAAAVDKALTAMETGTKGANAALVTQLKAGAAKASGRDIERYEGIARILSKA
jgi:hypothetical protein